MSSDLAQPGMGPYRCPFCKRPTPVSYRCKNHGCGADLVGIDVDMIDLDRPQVHFPDN